MTLAPPILWHETEEFVQLLFPSFPLTRVSLVNTNGRKEIRSCSEQSDCQKSYHSDDLEVSTEDEVIFQAELSKYQQALYMHNMEDLLKMMPLHSLLFSPALRTIHERLVTSRPLPNTFIVPCLPGYSRRFCDSHGNYFSCERVENSKRYLLGNVETGYDAKAASKLIRWFNEATDCGNCVFMKTCNLCYAAIPSSDSGLPLITTQLKHSCHQIRDTTPNVLRKYVEIMERNPIAFGSDEESNENSQITFLPKNNRQ